MIVENTKVLKNFKVAILVADGFEQSEMTGPQKALEEAGAKTEILSLAKGKVKGWKHAVWGDEFQVDKLLQDANSKDYQALLLPGGLMSPDKLRINPDALNFVKGFINEHKPIAAICHGSWTLINAEGVKNKTMTSWPAIKVDLINAGAHWLDKEVVRDGNLVTSRKPDDIPAFNREMLKMFAEYNH